MLGVVGPKVFDSHRAGGYIPLDFPLFGRFVLGVLGTEQDKGEEQRMRSLDRGGAHGPATDQRRSVSTRGNARLCNQGRDDVDRKVRTEV
jgi:hypothetical protein